MIRQSPDVLPMGDGAVSQRDLLAQLLNVVLWVVATIAVVLTIVNFMAVHGPLSWRPMLNCDESVWNVGEVAGKKSIEHTFKLINSGGKAMTVSRIVAECRCTKVSPSEFPQVIAPGGFLLVSSRLNLKGLSGPFKKRLYVLSDDPTHPRFEIAIQGEIVTATAGAVGKDDDEM